MNITNRIPFSHLIKDYLFSIVGVLIAGFALQSLLVPNGFLDGGVTGISLLLHEFYHWPLSVIIVVANLPFIIMSAFLVNRHFATKTLASIILLGLFLQFFPYPNITPGWQSMILVSIFGGFFLGIGIGLAMRGGCAIDGIEILALYTLRKVGFTISEIILGMNALIFMIAAMSFGLEKAFYAMLTYYVATRTIDYVVEGIEEYTGVTIISGQSEIIKDKLAREMGRGITIYKGERGFLKQSFEVSHDCDIVFTVITRLEVRKLKRVVYQLDPNAFVFTHSIKEAAGGILKRHAGH
jgi:uncharacterized membrane-anchored protein YitT (DUF2179 family)